MNGEFHSRLPVGKGDDDIEKVTRAVNLMLDEIERLLDQLKSVGDNIAHDLRTPLTVARARSPARSMTSAGRRIACERPWRRRSPRSTARR